jgi:hypothetical protein
MSFPIEKRLFSHSSKPPPMSRTGGKPTRNEGEPSLFSATPTWNSFRDAIKEQYYPVGSYEDKYIQWTTLWQQRDQDVREITNLFHTLCTKLGIKDSDKHLVLKYHSCLHRYISGGNGVPRHLLTWCGIPICCQD